MVSLITILVLAVALLAMTVKVVPEHGRLMVYRLGKRLDHFKGPGLVTVIPVIDKTIRVGANTKILEAPPMEILTADAQRALAGFELLVDPGSGATRNVGVEQFLKPLQVAAQPALGRYDMANLKAAAGKIVPGLGEAIQKHAAGAGMAKVEVVLSSLKIGTSP